MLLVSNISKTHLSIRGFKFQLVAICYQFTTLFFDTAFKVFPIFSGRLIVGVDWKRKSAVSMGLAADLGCA